MTTDPIHSNNLVTLLLVAAEVEEAEATPAEADPEDPRRYRFTASSPYLTFTNFDPDVATM